MHRKIVCCKNAIACTFLLNYAYFSLILKKTLFLASGSNRTIKVYIKVPDFLW